MTKRKGFATRSIHLGYDPMDHVGALTPPLHLTSTFAFETAEAGGEIFAGDRSGHIYSRISARRSTCLSAALPVSKRLRQGLRWRPAWERSPQSFGRCSRPATR